MRSPLIPVAFSFIAGILIGNRFHLPNSLVLAILSIALAICLVFIVRRNRFQVLVFLCLTLISSGFICINSYLRVSPGPLHISNLNYPGLIGLEGVVLDNPNRKPDRTDIVIEAVRVVQNGIPVPIEGRVLLTIITDSGQAGGIPRYGDLVRCKVKLKRPENFNNPGGFDFKRHLGLKGIFVRGTINDAGEFVIIRRNVGNPFISRLESFRDRLRDLIREHAPAEQATILQAMVLGEQNEIPREILAKFNRTGTTHILAISGFNVGIVFILFLLAFKTLLKSSEYLLLRFNLYKLGSFLAAIPVIFYTYMAGLGMSVVRAAVMVLALVVAAVSGKGRDLPNTLALAALIMVAVYPPAFFDVSFQLSFAAVAGILFIVPRFTNLIPAGPADPLHPRGWLKESLHTALRSFWIFILVTMAATLATIPLTTYYFNTFSLIVIAGNVLLVPILGYAVILLGMGIIIAAPLWKGLTILMIQAASWLIRISLNIADTLSSFPYASIYTTTPTIIELVVFYLLLIALVLAADYYLVRREPARGARFYLTITAVAIFIFFFVFDFAASRIKDGQRDRLEVTFIDVGQGNSALVRLPGGENMMIDGGGFFDDRFDVGRNVVAPFLWHEKIRTIGTVILTHPHPDHLRGLLFILRNFSVGEVWSSGKTIDDESYDEFKKIIEEQRIKHRILHAGQVLKRSGVSIRVLNPAAAKNPSAAPDLSDPAINDDSLVLKFTLNQVGFLFPGDISEEAEARLVRRERGMASQVLLAPHHGSNSSSSVRFIKAVHPDLVIFSCGRNNRFHFPRPEVESRYREAGAKIYRTDRQGAITIETDGARLFTRSFLNGH